MCMHGAPFDYKGPHQSRGVGSAGFPHCLPLSPLGLTVLGVGWSGIYPGVEVERVLSGVSMPFKPLTWVLLERIYHP